MDGNRLAGWKELAENAEGRADRGDLEDQPQLRESQGRYASAAYESPGLEMWRRGLSASIQPPLSVVESPLRSPVDPSWLREAHRGTREDIRRLVRPSRQGSQSGSRPRLSALGRPDLTRLGSDDAGASSERAAPREAPEGARVPLPFGDDLAASKDAAPIEHLKDQPLGIEKAGYQIGKKRI